jgi:hypothetical protein
LNNTNQICTLKRDFFNLRGGEKEYITNNLEKVAQAYLDPYGRGPGGGWHKYTVI